MRKLSEWDIQLAPRGSTVVKDGVDISDEITAVTIVGHVGKAPRVTVTYLAGRTGVVIEGDDD